MKSVGIVGVTGGIASGKSTVCKRLAELGARVVSADDINREVMQPYHIGWQRVRDYFGETYFLPDCQLDRRKLAALVFANESSRQALNAIIHPVMADIAAQRLQPLFIDEKRVLEAPLLLEGGWQRMVDEVWLVLADRQEQLQRVMLRDGLTVAQAEARIDSQMSQQDKIPYARKLLCSGDIGALRQQVDRLWEEWNTHE